MRISSYNTDNPEHLEIDADRVHVFLRSTRKRKSKRRIILIQGSQEPDTFTGLLRLRIVDYYREENAKFLQRPDEDLKKEDDTILRLFRSNRFNALCPGRVSIENHKGVNVAKIVFNYDADGGYLFTPGPAFPSLTTNLLFGLAYTPVVSLASVFRLFIMVVE
jgi:hypothetical protein